MISRVRGKIVSRDRESVEILTDCGLCYRVLVAPVFLKELSPNEEVELHTYMYFQNEPSRGFLTLVGFSSPVEREFFELFITVSGIGPKAAIKSFTLPVSVIAKAISEGDQNLLCSMPGIGRQRARQIIARLQDKIAKFVLIKDEGREGAQTEEAPDVFEEALEVLLQLQYRKSEAKAMIEKVKGLGKRFDSVEQVLEEIYRRR